MPRAVPYATLPTEQPHPRSRFLDRLAVDEILRLMNAEDALVPRAIARVIPQMALAVSRIVNALQKGGHLVFVGAGTSGRLGVLEAAECPPTFNTPPVMVQAIMAGGRQAVFRSQEGAEDRRGAACDEVKRRVRAGDVVVGIAASGVTPFVESALHRAKVAGASTIFITCDRAPRLRSQIDVLIAPRIGAELITGSTRLKAGTATKLILNMLTVAAMVKLGKVYGNVMVDVRPTSRKLKHRALRMIEQLGGVSSAKASRLLSETHGQVKVAIVMAARQLDARRARQLLKRHHGMLRDILSR